MLQKHPTLQTDTQQQLTDRSAEFQVEVKIKALSNKAFDQKFRETPRFYVTYKLTTQWVPGNDTGQPSNLNLHDLVSWDFVSQTWMRITVILEEGWFSDILLNKLYS